MCKWKRLLRILYNSLIMPYLQYCVLSWGFMSDRIFKLQKRAVRIITCSKYNAHTEPLLKTLNMLKLKISWIQKHWNYIIDAHKMNFQNVLNQCSLNQMIIIHMILDISLFYVITKKDKHWVVMYKTLYTRTSYRNTWMYNWKARYSFIQWFFKLYEKLLYSEL